MFIPRDVTLSKSMGQLVERPTTASLGKGEHTVTAFTGSGAGSSGYSGGSVTQSATSSNTLQSTLEGIMPDDRISRYKLFKDMYNHDPISGAAVDVLASGIGGFHLTGISDQKRMDKYAATADSINPSTLFPLMTREYLVHGCFIGTKLYDSNKGYITGVAAHPVTSVDVTTIPVHGVAPICDLILGDGFQKLIESKDPRIRSVLNTLPKFYQESMRSGMYPLTPHNTIFFPRQQLAGDVMGTSLYERTLPIYLIEKNLTRGTIDASMRRQRSILHAIVSGDEEFQPKKEYLNEISQAIKQADMDPQGAVVATREWVTMNQFMEPRDFWSVDQFSAYASEMKYFAYRISPEIINGTASLSTLDASLSIMVNDLRQYRAMFEQKIIMHSIFGDVAIANNFLRKDKGHHTYSADRHFKGKVYNLADYELPQIIWKQSLSPEGDTAYMDMLQEASRAGVPIPIAMYAAAAGVNFDQMMSSKDEDIENRKEAAKYWKAIMQNSPDLVQESVQNEFEIKQQAKAEKAQSSTGTVTQPQQQEDDQPSREVTAAIAGLASLGAGIRRKGWAERDWGDTDLHFHNTDSLGRYRTGTTDGRNARRDAIIKRLAQRLAENRRKENHEAKQTLWNSKHG